MLAILFISLMAAILSGIAIFAHAGGGRGSGMMDVVFCVSVAVFLGTLVVVLVRKAATTFEHADDAASKDPFGGKGRALRK